MPLRRWIIAGVAALALAVAAAPAPAGDPPRPDIDQAIARCRDLVKQEQWAQGEAAYRRLFADYADNPRVRARLREIEDGLKVCLFRKAERPLTGEALFGDGTKTFSPNTRDVVFSFDRLREPLWTDVAAGSGMKLLTVRLEGPLTIDAKVEFLTGERRVFNALICYDLEKRGGYVLSPGFYRSTDRSRLEAEPVCRRIDRVGEKGLSNRAGLAWWGLDYDRTDALRITRSGGEIAVRVGETPVVACSDSAYSSGFLALSAAAVRSVVIRGRVDKIAYRKLAAERYAKRFAEWTESAYDRDKEIPAWAREAAVATPDMTLTEVPSDAPRELRKEIVAAVERSVDGDDEAAGDAEALAAGAPPHAALYLRGVAAVARRGYKDAAESLDSLVGAEPDFVPGRMFRGIARFHLRRIDEAKADLAWTLERRPRAAEAVVFSAMIAIFEQDFAGADALLERADQLGVAGEGVDEVRDWVHRAKTGPNFSQRFEHASDHFVVVSDHSKKVCYDAATLLESMQQQYAAALGSAPAAAAGRRARVYVFSGRDGYFDYADDLHVRADSSSGVYLPMLRELAIWIPADMTDFTDTVRHEGFHQYLHRLVEDAPIWFNEGYAGFMGGGGPEGVRDAGRDGDFVKAFVPVKTLVAMKQPEFMKNAGVTYTESRYLVDFLRRTKNAKLKNLLKDYFAAIAAGLSQAEANAKVLDPVMALLEIEFRDSR